MVHAWLPSSHSHRLLLNVSPKQCRTLFRSSPRCESFHGTHNHGQPLTWVPVLPVMHSFPAPLSKILLAQAGPPLTPVALRESSNFDNIFEAPILTEFRSDIESLKQGVVKTSKNKANAQYNILLIGEIGAGKSSILEFIANVFFGNDVDHYNLKVLDRSNERSAASNRSRTASPRLYEITSKHGISVSINISEGCEYSYVSPKVRILDTPGLVVNRGTQRDESHKKSVVTIIEQHMDYVSAVLILVSGVVPRTTAGMDYALSTLSAIFPKTLTSNIAFVFTNVSDPLAWDFSQQTVPEVLKGARHFIIDNPIALQRDYLRYKGDPNTRTELREVVKACEQRALEMLVKLFDWLDGLEPQAATEIIRLNEKYQNIETKTINILDQIDRTVTMKGEINSLMIRLQKLSTVSLSPSLRLATWAGV